MFEVGKYYQAANGAKTLCVHRFACGDLLFASEKPSTAWRTIADGRYTLWDGTSVTQYQMGEWREPAKALVEVYRHRRENRFQAREINSMWNPTPIDWELIARKEITEGEGL